MEGVGAKRRAHRHVTQRTERRVDERSDRVELARLTVHLADVVTVTR